MAVYKRDGTQLSTIYDRSGTSLQYAYDVHGNEIFSGDAPEPWVKTYVTYDTAYITDAWLENAVTQRDAIKTLYQASNNAIPFFIQTDGHGKYNEGNKGCHNKAEETMRYIMNIQLGDWGSYYDNGANATRHKQTSEGITNYLPAMGNHEFLSNNSAEAPIASLPVLVDSFVSPNAILGSETYGYYKVIDSKRKVKWLVTQPHIPVDKTINSSGFLWKMTGDQYEWLIDELEANDTYDIVVIQHEPLNGTYTTRGGGTSESEFTNMSIGEILAARKAKTNGSYTDSDGVTHSYDFRSTTTDLLCSLHGHNHAESYMTKATLGFPVYVADDFDNDLKCLYGLIDRTGGKLYIYTFGKTSADNVLTLDL